MPILPHVPKLFNGTSLVMIYLRQRVVSRPFTDPVQIYPHVMQWYSTACIQHTNILLEPKLMKPLDKTVKLFCFLFSLFSLPNLLAAVVSCSRRYQLHSGCIVDVMCYSWLSSPTLRKTVEASCLLLKIHITLILKEKKLKWIRIDVD